MSAESISDPGGSANPVYSHAEVLEKVRSHLVESLEVEPDAIAEDTRFREDLEADSLDLYELVMELEDGYGISIPEEEAAKIKTVGQAVDYVLTRVPAG